MASEKVRVEDLIDLLERESALDPLSQSALKKKLDTLQRSHRSLAVPLSDSKRARIERKAAYKLASQEAGQWDEIVALNARAPQLDLREVHSQDISLYSLCSASITKSDRPDTLQAQVQRVLEDSNKDTDHPSEEEREENTTAVRAMARSDMFHQYLKMKRAAKIKSKKYHKQKRKAAVGVTETEEKEQEEMARAQERISQRHSRAKRLKRSLKYAHREADFRNEALTANDQLAQRIKHPSRLTSAGKVTHTNSSDSEAEVVLTEDTPTGVMAMKFMQEAMQRDREQMKKTDDFEEMDTEKSLAGKMTFTGKKSKSEARKSEPEITKKPKISAKSSNEEAKEKVQEALIDKAFNMTEMDEVAAEEWQQEQPTPQETSLKGWGSWYGAGMSRTPSKSTPTIPKIACEKVIRNTDRIKSAAKYLVKRLPFPYSSKEQFDAGHKIPIGKDWNTHRSHQKLIASEVVLRPGEMIKPIKKPEEE